MEHDYTDQDNQCQCQCGPIRHDIQDQQEMFKVFGKIWEDLETPCYIWEHREPH